MQNVATFDIKILIKNCDFYYFFSLFSENVHDCKPISRLLQLSTIVFDIFFIKWYNDIILIGYIGRSFVQFLIFIY